MVVLISYIWLFGVVYISNDHLSTRLQRMKGKWFKQIHQENT